MNLEKTILNIIESCKYDIGIYVTDMHDNVIKYNENAIFETASCIKTFILIEYFKQLYEGKISKDDYFEYTEMDNIPGSNSGIIKNFDYGLKFKNTRLLHKINLPKYLEFATTTPYEYARVFEMLYNGEIVNQEVSDNCLNILKRQEHRDMIEKYLPPLDMVLMGDDTSNINYIASKSGGIVWEDNNVKNIRNDGGIISTKSGDYIISIFISNLDDLRYNFDNKGIEIGGQISKLIYDNFIKKNDEGEIKR